MRIFEVVSDVIDGIGEDGFAGIAADALCRFMNFELSAVVLHSPNGGPRLMFDSFDAVDGRQGIQTYLRHTYAINPMVRGRASGAIRARDFAPARLPLATPYLVVSAEEELGFRTNGWPRGLEEIGLYFEACGGLVELGLYRERSHVPADAGRLGDLDGLTVSIAAAFEKHWRVSERRASRVGFSVLSTREQEIAGLLLAGCSSEAIALRLGISRHTVRDHRKNIFRKLGIASLAELFAFAR